MPHPVPPAGTGLVRQDQSRRFHGAAETLDPLRPFATTSSLLGTLLHPGGMWCLCSQLLFPAAPKGGNGGASPKHRRMPLLSFSEIPRIGLGCESCFGFGKSCRTKAEGGLGPPGHGGGPGGRPGSWPTRALSALLGAGQPTSPGKLVWPLTPSHRGHRRRLPTPQPPTSSRDVPKLPEQNGSLSKHAKSLQRIIT